MTEQEGHNLTQAMTEALTERCQAIGAPLWVLPAHGTGASLCSCPIALRPLCDGLTADVWRAYSGNSSGDGHVVSELFDGVWVGWIPSRAGRSCEAAFATVLFGAGAADAPEFAAHTEQVRDAIAAGSGHTAESARQMTELLRSVTAGIGTDLKARAELDTVSARLTEAYEDIGLLHLLGEAVNALTEPDRFVQMACDELVAITPSTWSLVLLDPMSPIARHLSAHSFSTGPLPLSPPAIAQLRQPILSRLATDSPVLGRDYDVLKHAGMGASALRPIVRDGRVTGFVAVGDKLGPDDEITSVDVKRLDATANSIATLLENARLLDDQQAMFMGTLHALTSAIDAKDPYTRGHSERVAHLAHRLSLVAGLDEAEAERNRISGLVHDVGKIGVRESVLRKNGRLTDAEYDEIKQHPAIGHHILSDIPQFGDLLPGVLYHHERYDGRGYPTGLAGDRIPLQARIIGLADAFDAMSSTRTYRAALPRERVLAEIRDGAGTQFDPDLAVDFMNVDLTEFDDLVARHRAGAEERAA